MCMVCMVCVRVLVYIFVCVRACACVRAKERRREVLNFAVQSCPSPMHTPILSWSTNARGLIDRSDKKMIRSIPYYCFVVIIFSSILATVHSSKLTTLAALSL